MKIGEFVTVPKKPEFTGAEGVAIIAHNYLKN